MDEVLIDQAFEVWLTVRRKAHHLVLARVDAKSDVLGECAIQEPEGMRKADVMCQLEMVAPTPSQRRRGPLSNAVEGEDSCLPERRGKKCTGCVRFVMISEDVASSIFVAECTVHFSLQMQLGLEPEG